MENRKFLFFGRLFPSLLLILVGLLAGIVVFTIVARLFNPYALERLEGASFVAVIRILSGQALYVQPSLEYVPLIYPPIYFYFSALATRLLGEGFAPLRLVSAMAFIGCLIVVFQAIKGTTKDNYAATVGAGFFAASYPLSGAWFDVARVDTLFIFFCILAIYFSARENWVDLFLSSLFWLLAIFTKQTGIMVLFASFAYLLIRNFRRNIIRFALTCLGFGLIYALCMYVWGKWFSYFFLYLPTFHKTRSNILEISLSFYQLVLPPLIAVSIGMLPFLLDRTWWSKEKPTLYYGFMTCVMFGFSFAARLNLGATANVYVPAHIMTAVMLGLGLNWWRNRFQSSARRSFSLPLAIVYVLCISQFLNLCYDPRLIIPSSEQVQNWSQLEDFMRSADGEILAPDLNYLTLFAGKAPLANQVALEEIFGGFGDAEPVQRDLIRKEIVNSLRAERFGFILLQYEGKVWDSVVDYYQCSPLSEVIDAKSLPLAVKAYQVCSPKTGPVE